MNITKVYVSRKLEEIVSDFICTEDYDENNYLGGWSSTLFFMNHKKCLLMINKQTKYTLILWNVKKGDLESLSIIFKKTLYEQLMYDGIQVDVKLIDSMIGEIKLFLTDNDKSANGSLNTISLTSVHLK